MKIHPGTAIIIFVILVPSGSLVRQVRIGGNRRGSEAGLCSPNVKRKRSLFQALLILAFFSFILQKHEFLIEYFELLRDGGRKTATSPQAS